MAIEHWSIPGAAGQTIFGTTHLPELDSEALGVLIICHGFKGYKDYGFFPQLAEQASRQGLIAHRFNFSHSGVTPEFETFARPELFERDTWDKQIEDLQAVHIASATALPGATSEPLPTVWYGHSRGGVTVLLTASRQVDARTGSPTGIVSAAAPCRNSSLTAEQTKLMHQLGYIETPSSRTGQMLRMGKQWLDEIEENPTALDPLLAIAQVRCPILLIHGDSDQTVPIDDAHRYQTNAKNRFQLEILPGASHVFNAPNPLPVTDSPPPATQKMIDLSVAFAISRCQPDV